jgi:hypothetical protein
VWRALPVAVLLVCALALCSCGDTLQNTPIGASPFESVIVNSRFPVYWLGLRFDGLQASNVREDPGGAVTIDYGNCLIGGQYTCVTPLQIVTSPDNSFVPGAGAGARPLRVRGLAATAVHGEATLAIRTGPVVVSVYARSASLARDAARTMGPLNEPGVPEAPLPPAIADTGFDRLPLRSQVPHGQGVPHPPGP